MAAWSGQNDTSGIRPFSTAWPPHPVLLRHAIEASPWSEWAWESREYRGWRELIQGLRDLLSGLAIVAMEVSEDGAIPELDRVPSGVVDLVRATGVSVTSSMDLVTVFHA